MENSIGFSQNSAINIIDSCLIFTLPGELNSEVISLSKIDILDKLNQKQLKGVILDFCSVTIINSYEFEQIVEIIKIVELMGAAGIIVGLQPGIVSTLIYLNVNTDNITTCSNLEEGLALLTKGGKKNKNYKNGNRDEEMHGAVPKLISKKSILLIELEDSHSAQFAAKNIAIKAGFNTTDQTLIATVASELATNILRYAKSGELILKIIELEDYIGIEIEANDDGPGIENIDDALKDSFTTSKSSLGLGLPSAKRIMDDFIIKSEVGKGTNIVARKWRRKSEA